MKTLWGSACFGQAGTEQSVSELLCLCWVVKFSKILFSGQEVFLAALDTSAAQQKVVWNIWHTECMLLKLNSGLQNDCWNSPAKVFFMFIVTDGLLHNFYVVLPLIITCEKESPSKIRIRLYYAKWCHVEQHHTCLRWALWRETSQGPEVSELTRSGRATFLLVTWPAHAVYTTLHCVV